MDKTFLSPLDQHWLRSELNLLREQLRPQQLSRKVGGKKRKDIGKKEPGKLATISLSSIICWNDGVFCSIHTCNDSHAPHEIQDENKYR